MTTTNLNKEFDKFVAEKEKEFEKEVRDFHKGFLTEDEIWWQINNVYVGDFSFKSYKGFWANKDLSLQISEENWKDVLADYEKWSQGEAPDSRSEKPWLQSDSGLKSKSIHTASESERAVFFRCIDYMKLPIAYYEPIPDHIVRPCFRYTMYGPDLKWDIWGIVDDGGLIADPEPIGKTFVLTDKYGLKTRIDIQHMGTEQCEWRTYKSDYLGMGTIEGYTSSTPVEIEIWLTSNKDRVDTLTIYAYGNDPIWNEHYDAYHKFPLWQEYFRESEKRHNLFMNSEEAFIKRVREKYK